MKKIAARLFLFGFFVFASSLVVLADNPGPPPPGGDPTGTGGTPVGAPIDDGLFILLALSVGYGMYKLYETVKAGKNVDAAHGEDKQ
jgi:hypothetical protein